MKNNLKKIRTQRDVSQAQLAQLAGVSQQLISRIEAEEEGHSPRLESLVNIGNALGVSVDDLTKVKNSSK